MALYNHLYAKKVGGKWMMRVEDTDAVRRLSSSTPFILLTPSLIWFCVQTRFVPNSVDGIRHALDWAGLEYDYGLFSVLNVLNHVLS